MKQSTTVWRIAALSTFFCLFAALFRGAEGYAQCGQWQPVPSNTTQLLRAVHFPDAQNGWVVGSGGTLLRSTDGGASWTTQTTALGAGGRDLYSVHFASATTGWVVGAGGFVKKTTDGGGAWTTQTTNTTTDLYDVFFSDANTGWIVGGCGLILRTVNGGGQWTQVGSGQNYHLTAVATANGSNVAAASTGAVLLQSSNAGVIWSPGNGLTSDRNFRALAFSGATGWAANTDGQVWKTANGGSLWLYWGSSAPFTGVWQSASATSTANVYLAGLGGKLVRSTNGGSVWADFSDGITAEDLYGVQVRDDNTGWAVGAGGAVFRYGCAVAACAADSLELVKLYNATNGPGWTNKWDLSKPMKTWYGIQVNAQGCVTCIDLDGSTDCGGNSNNGNGLSGTLPNLNLSKLVTLSLSFNQIQGSIPNFDLPLLQELGLTANRFTGTIPLFNLPNLRYLWLRDNRLTGPVPNFNLPLQNFTINNNQFTFEGLPFHVGKNYFSFIYAPQDSIFRDTTLSRTAGQALTIDLGIDAGLSTNVYQWYKNGSPWTPPAGNTTNSNKLIFNALQVSDAGMYHVRVTNPGAPALTLYGRAIRIQVQAAAPSCTRDSLALVALYNAANGPNWIKKDNWLVPGQPLRAWYGVTTHPDGCVKALALSLNNLNGTLPTALGNLTALEQLNLSINNLTGIIPPSLGQLTQLALLNLSRNQLSGSIPDSLGQLVKLTGLYLNENGLTGSIPASLGNLTSLEYLNLSRNQLGGLLPSGLFVNWVKLQECFLNNNQFTGSLPNGVGSGFKYLRRLNFSYNQFTGTTPPDLGYLPAIDSLFLNNNQLSGCLPAALKALCIKADMVSIAANPTLATQDWAVFCNSNAGRCGGGCNPVSDSIELVKFFDATDGLNWKSKNNWKVPGKKIDIWYGVTVSTEGCVTQLWLGNNSLKGSLPNFNLPNLQIFNCAVNSLSGSIPNFDKLPNLQTFYCFDNSLSGSIPNFDKLPNLLSFDCSFNDSLGSSIPNFDKLPNLQFFHCGTNNLSGSIPNFDKLPNLQTFDCSDNSLSGSIPNFDKLPNLQRLYCSGNDLSGSIPNFDKLPNLQTFDCPDNSLSGSIPNFDKLPNLLSLSCSRNDLGGSIPKFDKLPNLQLLSCSDNDLSGSIPNFDKLPNLQTFDCSSNSLSGSIPNFDKLPNLQTFDCSDNSLSGSIPNFDKLPNLLSLSCSGNDLSGSIPNFDKLPNLKTFDCLDNSLSGSIPNFDKLPNLLSLSCSRNDLGGSIPNFDKLPNLKYFYCYFNLYTFENILPTYTMLRNKTSSYRYFPQKTVFHDTLLIRSPGQNLDFSLDFDENIPTNIYKWYKYGTYQPAQDQIGNNNLVVNNLQASHAGGWTVGVTNPGVPDLTLFSRTITLSICTPPAPKINGPTVLCAGTATLDAGSSFQGYIWSNGQSTRTINVATTGTYTVTVSDANGCTGTDTRIIGPNVLPPAPQILGPTALCNSQPVNLDAGTGFTAYKWSNGATTQSITAGTSNTYTVTVTNAQGCEGTATKTVNGSAPAPSTQILGPTALCNNQPVNLDAGTGFTAYKWSNGATTQAITANNSNTYTVTVTNAQGCEGTAAKTVNGSAPTPSTQILGPSALCNNQPVSLDAGAGFIAYKWSNGAMTQAITASSSNTYTVTVTNAQGCEGTAVKTVGGSAPAPSTQILGPSALCNNQPVFLDAGTGFTAYKWSNGATTQNITANISNTYTVTVTNAQGCEGTAVKTVNGSAPIPSTQILGPTALCNNQPVSLDAGTGFTAYKWSNGATTQSITASTSNTYTVTVTNAQGCEGTAVKTVGGAAPAPAPTFNNTPTGLCTAPIPLDAGSGYTSYVWSNGQSTQTILVSQAGSYRVTVGDAKGCTGTASATLVQHPPLNPPLATAQAAACGQNNGSIALAASGGTLPYRYNWSHNATVQNPTGLSVGPYTATVTDANHCSATATATILSENGPSAAPTPTPTRCGLANGSIALALNGGTAPFVFLWNNSSAQGQNPVNLPAGTYAVTIRDARNCETLASATVGASQAPALGIAGPGAVCSGAPVTLRATPGFVNYAWSVPGQTADSLRTNTAGTYTVTATDANNCSAVATQTVSQAPAPALSIGGATAYCPGIGTVLDAGGNHTDYQWSVPGQTARTLSVNTAGTYTVTVSNAAGCTSSRSVTVREHPAPEAILVANEGSGLPNDNAICEGANVLFSAYGGTQYHFSINGTTQGAASPSALFTTSKLADGDVIGVWLLDANGCQDSTILGEPPGKAPIALRVHPYPDWTGGQISLVKACANQAVSLRLRAPQLPDGPYQVSYLLSGANVSPLITKQVDLNGGYGFLDLGLLPKNGATTCRILALRNAAGCERALNQNQVFSFENGSGTRRDLDTTICTGQVVVVNNRVFAQTGTYSETILRPSGCDSTVVLDLKVVTEIRKELSVSICSGQSYFFNGAARNETGFYRDTLPSIGGCDSLVTLLLSVRTPIFKSISASICAGKAFSVGPKQYTESGNYTDTLTTAAGCDSLVLLRLTVLPPVSSNLSATICAGESFLFGGRPYAKSGHYTDTLKTSKGCDSLAHLDLTVLNPTVNLGPDKVFCAPGNVTLVAETSGCNNCTYQWSSAATHKTAVLTVSPSSPTTYAVTVKDAKGCSNTDQVKVSPQQAITKTATAVLCDGGRYIDGTDTLYRPGDYVLRRKTSTGCDSLIALTLSAVQAQDFSAQPDTGYLLPDERSAEFDILANDLFPDDKSLALIEPAPAHGDAKLTKLEQLVYTVYDDDFFGYDTIYYQLCPPQDCPEACDTGMLVLFVQSGKVEDAKKIMPNAFTPNGDGKNDVFDPLQTLEQNGLLVPRDRAELSILNSFGEIVFFKRPYEEWDGTSDGRPMPQATYYYLLRFGDAPPLKGPVTLFR